MQLIVAGYETTSTAFVNGVHALCTHPEQRQRFEAADAQALKNAVEEILRYVGPQAGLFRTASRDLEIGGCPILKNAKIRVAFASANRDEDAFTAAHALHLDRDAAELRAHLAWARTPVSGPRWRAPSSGSPSRRSSAACRASSSTPIARQSATPRC
jgi:cytochrome P450